MLNYIQTIEVLTEAYEDCINYWKGQRKPIADAKRLARKDIQGMTTNPFSPGGKQLNIEDYEYSGFWVKIYGRKSKKTKKKKQSKRNGGHRLRCSYFLYSSNV